MAGVKSDCPSIASSSNVTINVNSNGTSSMSQSADDCPNGNGPEWWDFPGWAFTGLGNLMLKGHETQGLKQMAYAYGGEIATGLVAGEIIQGLGTVVRSAGGKIVVERVMSRAELEATESTGLLRGGRATLADLVEDDGESEIPDPPEPIENGMIDLGRLATDVLLLAIDPYPRKPDAVFEPVVIAPDPEDHPFAALKVLKPDASPPKGKKPKSH